MFTHQRDETCVHSPTKDHVIGSDQQTRAYWRQPSSRM